MISQERVKKLFNYNPLTGDLIRLETVCSRGKKGTIVGYLNNLGYLETRVDGKLYRNHRLIWLWVYGYLPENCIDHINRDRLDNRLINLREVSQSCNLRNTPNRADNLSGVKGVYWDTNRSKWHSMIRLNSKSYSIGRYKSFDDAVAARLAAEQCLGWEGCDSSSPTYLYLYVRLK